MMRLSFLLLLLLTSGWAQVPDPECPLTPDCCEEDCCGQGSSYSPTSGGCFANLTSSGWPGQYTDTYLMGCDVRACCEAGCCDQGTIYDSSTSYCVPAGSISGAVKGDQNNDNLGDIDLAGVPIKLLDSNGTTVLATTLTAEDGSYAFFDLVPGTYSVMETNIVTFPFDVSDADAGDFNMITVTIQPGGPLNSTGNDFLDELSRIIKGVVLEDLDNNNTGDVPIPNTPIALIDSSGVIVATTLTDSAGRFEFEAPPGVYTVMETNLPGFTDVSDTDTPAP